MHNLGFPYTSSIFFYLLFISNNIINVQCLVFVMSGISMHIILLANPKFT